MAFPLILAPILATLAKKGLNLIGEAVIAKGKDYIEKKTGITLKEDMSSEDLLALQRYQAENFAALEKICQDNLTSRHNSDMASDSWLSKNIRPFCLIAVTVSIMVGLVIPDLDPVKFTALTDMAQWVYGYYFIGRSAEKPNFMTAIKRR